MRSFKRWSKITHIDPVACSLDMNKHSGICQIIQKLNILPAIWLWFNHSFFGNVVDRNDRMSSLKTISNGQDMWENLFKLRILNEICFEFLLNSSPHQQKRKSVGQINAKNLNTQNSQQMFQFLVFNMFSIYISTKFTFSIFLWLFKTYTFKISTVFLIFQKCDILPDVFLTHSHSYFHTFDCKFNWAQTCSPPSFNTRLPHLPSFCELVKAVPLLQLIGTLIEACYQNSPSSYQINPWHPPPPKSFPSSNCSFHVQL